MQGTGKVYSTNFHSFQKVHLMMPDGEYYAVCVGHGWKRYRTEAMKIIKWQPVLGPSKELLKKAMSGEVSWDKYRVEYLSMP